MDNFVEYIKCVFLKIDTSFIKMFILFTFVNMISGMPYANHIEFLIHGFIVAFLLDKIKFDRGGFFG